MGWAQNHQHDWQWAVDEDDFVLSLILPGFIFGWQLCNCGQWRIRTLKEQAAAG
jgi:hypothetical protein